MRFGLIDIGSNSVKCNIYEYASNGGSLRLILAQSRTLGLIRYIENRKLREDGIAVLMQTVEEYCRLISELRGEQTFCVATASLRNLENGQEICDRISRAYACRMRIISAKEEALLGFRAVMNSLSLTGSRGVLIDMGGASTELTAFENGEVKHAVSLPMGCLKLYLENVSNILPDKTERKAIRARTLELLSEAPWLAEYGKNLFLIGGTAKTLGRLLCTRTDAKFEDGMCFQAEELEALYRAYRTPGKKKIRSIIDAAPDRLHSFLPGLIAYHCIAERAGTQTITITFAGVRDGLALSVLEDMEEEG